MNNAVMMKHHDANRDELVRCLEIAWKNNSGYGDWRRGYVLASLYAYVLQDKKSAEKVIRHAIVSAGLARTSSCMKCRFAGMSTVAICRQRI